MSANASFFAAGVVASPNVLSAGPRPFSQNSTNLGSDLNTESIARSIGTPLLIISVTVAAIRSPLVTPLLKPPVSHVSGSIAI